LETLLSEISKERDKIDAEIVEVLKTWQVGEKAAIAFKDTIKISYVLISVMELQNAVFRQWSAGLKDMKGRIETTNEVIEINTVRNIVETDLNLLISEIQKIDYVCRGYTNYSRKEKENEIKIRAGLIENDREQQITELQKNNVFWTSLFGKKRTSL